MNAERKARYEAYVADWEPADEERTPDQFLLIEVSAFNRQEVMFSTYDTPQDAADAHYNQEYPGDWEIIEIVDLDTDEKFEVVHVVTKATIRKAK